MKWSQLLLLLLTVQVVYSSASADAGGSTLKDLVQKNLKTDVGYNAREEFELLKQFSETNKLWCQQWTQSQLSLDVTLRDACALTSLLEKYKSFELDLSNSEKSGVEVVISSIPESIYPTMAVGSWYISIFSKKDGRLNSFKYLLLRSAMEKSLQANMKLRKRFGNVDLIFNSMHIPRLVASLSGYSSILRNVVFRNAILELGGDGLFHKNLNESLNSYNVSAGKVIKSINLQQKLANLVGESQNHMFERLKTIQELAGLFNRIKNESTQQNLLNFINFDVSDSLIEKTYIQYLKIADGVGIVGGEEVTNMYVAAFILSEINLTEQKISNLSLVETTNLEESESIQEEVNQLESYIVQALMGEFAL